MEGFRPLVADSAVLTAVNTRMVTPKDFLTTGKAVALTASGRKGFIRAYEQRMDNLVTHPLFDYRVSYRRILEIQARLLARYLTGELPRTGVRDALAVRLLRARSLCAGAIERRGDAEKPGTVRVRNVAVSGGVMESDRAG